MNRIELDNRKKAVKILNTTGWHAVPIENKAQNGTPDMNAAKWFESSKNMFAHVYREIWIEFKIVEEWPKRATTAIKIKHFSQEQKTWLTLRMKHNPHCYIMIQIEEDHLLFKVNSEVLANLGSRWTKQDMMVRAQFVNADMKTVLKNLEEGILT